MSPLGISGQQTLEIRESPQAKMWGLGTAACGTAGCRQNGQGTNVKRTKSLTTTALKGDQKKKKEEATKKEETEAGGKFRGAEP